MKKLYFLVLLTMTGLSGVLAQTTVFIDDFNRATVSPGGVPSMTYTNTLVGTSTAAITSNALRIANGTTSGISYVTGSNSTFSSPYNNTLSSNATLVTWTFNFRFERTTNPAGISSGSYGTAIVLAGSSSTLTTGTGYAIVYGNSSTPDPIRLVAYSSGVSTSTDIISSGVADLSAFTNYVSVRVTYNPSTNGWSLYIRDDGTTAWADPAIGVNTQIGSTTVNSTYTSTPLTAFGFIWSHASTVAATNASSFDNYKVTLAAPSPTINVSATSLTGFTALSGVNSAQQQYDVDGNNLTTDIVLTPPVGFGISTTSGGPYTFNPGTIALTPVAGSVASTTIYVVMNSTTLGANSGDISHTSTGATTKNVTLTGNVLAAEPTVQSSITFGLITNNSIVVNFGGGNGARRILLAKLATAVNSDPVDGTTYTANANFGSGTQIGTGNYVVYDGAGGTQLVTGLTAGATYHFAIYDYNDGGVAGAENYLVPGGINNTTVASYSVPYVWIGLNNGLWTNPLNWLPTRLFPATNDSLLFIDGMLDTVLNVPTQSVGYIGVSLNTRINLQAGASGNTLTVGNLTGTDLFVEAGSQLNISSANNLTIQVVTGATASISGSMRFTAGVHKMIAADASAVTFNSGSVFTAGTGFTSNPFGPLGTTANSVIFTNGSRFDQISGGNPFVLIAPASIVVFQTGSLFRMLNNQLPSLSGRTYADLEIDAPGFSQSGTGTNLLTVDNLTVTQGILNINLTGSPVIFGGVYIKGNINVAPGQTLTFTPVSLDTITFNGTAAQSINNSGTFSIGPFVSLIMNNAAGLTVNTNLTMGPTTSLTLTSGVISLTPVATTLLSLGTGTVVTGASNASFVNGKVKKTGNTLFTFPVGKTNCGVTANKKGYAPVTISNFVGTSASTDTYTVEYIRGSARALGGVTVGLDHVSACDYWTLDVVGAPTVDLTLSWQDSINNCTTASPYVNNLPALVVAHFDGATWNTFGAPGTALGNAASGTVTYPGVSVFSPFAIGSIDFSNPLPITINYFTGTKNNGSHLLNWKVTCVSTPSATIEVERSIDGRNYSSIYSINATALRCQQPFDYADNQPAKGVNYYRLKMTDVDGKITYSTVVSLINASKGIDVMNIAPNPIVNGRFNLKVSAAEKVQMQLQITDMQGRILQTQAVSMIAGFNSIPVNVRNLSAGTYQLFGNTDDGRTRVLRFVIQ